MKSDHIRYIKIPCMIRAETLAIGLSTLKTIESPLVIYISSDMFNPKDSNRKIIYTTKLHLSLLIYS